MVLWDETGRKNLPDSRLENWDKSAADLTWKVGQSDQSDSQDADG